jgi:catalase
LGGAQKRIQYRQCAIFTKAHEEYGRRVAEGLKLDPKEVARLAGLSAEDRATETAFSSVAFFMIQQLLLR